MKTRRQTLQLAVAVLGLAAGGAFRVFGAVAIANALWATTAALALAPSSLSMLRALIHRRAGVDIVAVLALLGTLLVGEYLAGAVIALMLATGRELEARASARARRELTALLDRAPSVVHRVEGDTLTTPPIDSVHPGDLLLVAPGEVVPVDGQVASDSAVLDESALTGEAALIERSLGDPVRSGGVNAGGAFRLRATAAAAESTYAGIVRLVRAAEGSRAPLVRVADRFALWFVPLTIALAALAGIVARDPIRAVAVLVVATPCPLILAAPVALVGGMSRAARRGVVIKGGAALEVLGRANVLLFDKTGTLTEGRARLVDIETEAGMDADEVLRLGASLDQVSTHVLARPIVQAAREHRLKLTVPAEVHEDAGSGVRGLVDGRRVMIGRAAYVVGGGTVPGWAQRVRRRTAYEGLANVFIGVDGLLVGAVVLEDPLRVDAQVRDAISRLDKTQLVVFASANAVEIFFDMLFELRRDARSLRNSRVCAIGPGNRPDARSARPPSRAGLRRIHGGGTCRDARQLGPDQCPDPGAEGAPEPRQPARHPGQTRSRGGDPARLRARLPGRRRPVPAQALRQGAGRRRDLHQLRHRRQLRRYLRER